MGTTVILVTPQGPWLVPTLAFGNDLNLIHSQSPLLAFFYF